MVGICYLMPDFTLRSPEQVSGTQKDDLLIEAVVSCSFEGTRIHKKGKQREQLDCKSNTRKQVGCVFYFICYAGLVFII